MSSDRRRPGKQKDQHLLTFVCLLMCCGPPVLVVGGVMIYQWALIRSRHAETVDAYNDAVREWNQPSRPHAAFQSASFTLALSEGTTPRLVDHLPAQLRPSAATEARPVFAGVEQLEAFVPLRFELVLPGQVNRTGIAINRMFDETLRVGLRLYSAVGEHSALVAEVPAFHVFRVAEVPTTALKCRHAYGKFDFGAGICTEMQVAEAVCVKVALAGVGAAAHWAPSSAGGGMGCDARDDWAPVRYKGVYTGIGDARLIEHVMPVVVRSADSPYILASDLTDGTLNFENTRTDKFALGVTLAIVGCGMSYPWAVMCKRKNQKGRGGGGNRGGGRGGSGGGRGDYDEEESGSEQRDLLSGRLSSSSDDDDEEDGHAAAAASSAAAAGGRGGGGQRRRWFGRGRRADDYRKNGGDSSAAGVVAEEGEEDNDDSSEAEEENDAMMELPAAPRPIGAPRIGGAAAGARGQHVWRPPPSEAKKKPSYQVTAVAGQGAGTYAKHVRARRTSAAAIPTAGSAGARGGGGHVRRAAAAVPAAPAAPAPAAEVTPHTAEQADPDLEFVALATALDVDLGSEEYLHDIIYEAILAPLPR